MTAVVAPRQLTEQEQALKQSLVDCKDMWQWLADRGASTEAAYPGLAFTAGGTRAYECHACGYVVYHYGCVGATCSHCPLVGRAWSRKFRTGRSDSVGFYCEHGARSAYADWKQAQDRNTRSNVALRIVAACDRALRHIEDYRQRRIECLRIG